MKNLILTPVYNAFDVVKEMCEPLDKYSELPFVHVLIDDNSDSLLDAPITRNRRVLRICSDVPELDHKNQLGQAVQLAYDYANQAFMNEIPNPSYDYVFLIESDVIAIEQGWDKKMIDLISTLPTDWASLDVQSVDEEGKLTYPTVISPRHGFVTPELEHQHYADFQACLFNPEVFKSGIKFSDFPSHFDILWSRKVEELTGRKHYRTTEVSFLHKASSSRKILMEKQGIK